MTTLIVLEVFIEIVVLFNVTLLPKDRSANSYNLSWKTDKRSKRSEDCISLIIKAVQVMPERFTIQESYASALKLCSKLRSSQWSS